MRGLVDESVVPSDGIGAGRNTARGKCELSFGQTAGLKQATIGNGAVRAEILLDKGANVRQFWHVPSGSRSLAEAADWTERLAEFGRNGCRGSNYSDCYEGGWQDVLPVRARWDGGAIGDGDGDGDGAGVGEAATVPWEVIRSLCTPVVAYLICRAKLPLCGLDVVKRFDVRRGAAALRVETTVRNATARDVRFSWTQHPALGGDLLDDTSRVWLPGGRARLKRDGELGYIDGDGADWAHDARAHSYSADALLPAFGTSDAFVTFAHVARGDAALASVGRGVGVRLRWDPAVFPHAWLWCARRDAITCVAVEPSTTYLPELCTRPEPQIMQLLKPGDALRTSIELSSFSVASGSGSDTDEVPRL